MSLTFGTRETSHCKSFASAADFTREIAFSFSWRLGGVDLGCGGGIENRCDTPNRLTVSVVGRAKHLCTAQRAAGVRELLLIPPGKGARPPSNGGPVIYKHEGLGSHQSPPVAVRTLERPIGGAVGFRRYSTDSTPRFAPGLHTLQLFGSIRRRVGLGWGLSYRHHDQSLLRLVVLLIGGTVYGLCTAPSGPWL